LEPNFDGNESYMDLRADFANIEDNLNLNIMGGPRRKTIE
jgi:hypothetical protein